MRDVFDEVKLGALTLPNRIVMAPLTRNRADRQGVPGALAPAYYAQRATAGLIIGEGAQPSAIGQGLPNTPGLYAEEHIAAWRTVTDAVHDADGRIFAQIMHTGRIGHPEITRYAGLPPGTLPLAPSPIAPEGMAKTYDGLREYVTPRAMTSADIATTIRDFADAARNAIAAGFDGIELHGASGVLLHQFLADGANQRTDEYGGSIANRIRFPVQVTEAVAAAIGPERVGLRVSPGTTFLGLSESDADELYPELARVVGEIGIAFLHTHEIENRSLTLRMRENWPTAYVVNPHLDDRRAPTSLAAAREVVEDGTADLVAFGRLFIANPDLPYRFRAGLPLNEPDPATFYFGDHRGYTDYPAYETY